METSKYLQKLSKVALLVGALSLNFFGGHKNVTAQFQVPHFTMETPIETATNPDEIQIGTNQTVTFSFFGLPSSTESYVEQSLSLDLFDDIQFQSQNCSEVTRPDSIRISCQNFSAENPAVYTAKFVGDSNQKHFIKTNLTVGKFQDLTTTTVTNISEPIRMEVGRTDNTLDGTSLIAGVNDISFLELIARNHSDDYMVITAIEAQAIGTENVIPYQNFTMAVFHNGRQEGSSQLINPDGSIIFDRLEIPVRNEATSEFEIAGNMSNNSAPGTIQFRVNDINAAAVIAENAYVMVYNGQDPLSVSNPINSAEFIVREHGELSVEAGNFTPESQILVANETEKDVFKLKFSANYDEIQVKDIYLQNAISDAGVGERADFLLYDETGNLIQTKQMSDGKLHFELANVNRIRVPKDGTHTITVKANLRRITRSSQTGKRLQLELDTDNIYGGIEAVTNATGSDIPTPATGWGNVTGPDFIIYRSNLQFENAAIQPDFLAATQNSAENSLYRFHVTADEEFQATLDKITLNISANDGVLTGGENLTSCDSLRLYRYADASFTGGETFVLTQANGSNSNCEISLAGSQEISSGGTNYYEIRTTETVTDTAAINDFVAVEFITDENYLVPETNRSIAQTTNAITWSDRSNNGGFGPYLGGKYLEIPMTATGITE